MCALALSNFIDLLTICQFSLLLIADVAPQQLTKILKDKLTADYDWLNWRVQRHMWWKWKCMGTNDFGSEGKMNSNSSHNWFES